MNFASKSFKNVIDSALSIGVIKIISLYKEIIIAATLSVSLGYDIFLFYLAFIGFPSSILLNSFQSVLIRSISRLQNLGRKRPVESIVLVNSITWLAIVLPILLLIWFSIFDFFLKDSGYFRSLNAFQTNQIKIWDFFIYAYLSSLNIVFYAFLQAKGKFRLNGILQGVTPIFCIIFLLSHPNNVQTLVWGFSVGAGVEFFILCYKLLEKRLFVFRRWRKSFSQFNKMVNLSKSLMLGFFCTASVPLLESSVLFNSGIGDISTYSFGSKVPVAISSVIVITAGIVALPLLSSYSASGKKRSLLKRQFLDFNLLALGIGLLIACLAAIFSEAIITIIFKRAKFNSDIITNIASVQAILFFQIPFTVLATISAKLLVAFKELKIVSFIMIIGAIANGLFLIIGRNGMSGAGVALTSTGISIFVSFVYFLAAIKVLDKFAPGIDV